jgi:hypothetical protein
VRACVRTCVRAGRRAGGRGVCACACVQLNLHPHPQVGKRVLVLEQHDVAGGSTHTFEDRGFEFDTGLHYIGGRVWKQGQANRMLLDRFVHHPHSWSHPLTATRKHGHTRSWPHSSHPHALLATRTLAHTHSCPRCFHQSLPLLVTPNQSWVITCACPPCTHDHTNGRGQSLAHVTPRRLSTGRAVDWAKMDDVFDVAITGGVRGVPITRFDVKSSLRQDLIKRFPNEANAIDAYFAEVKKQQVAAAGFFVGMLLSAVGCQLVPFVWILCFGVRPLETVFVVFACLCVSLCCCCTFNIFF